MTSDEDQIRQLVDTWMEATRRGDTDTVLQLMTDDVVFLVPGKAPFGREAFAQAAQSRPQGIRFDGRSQIQEIRVSGDLAYLWSRLTVTTLQPGQPDQTRCGYTLTVLRRDHGQWRLARDANLLGPPE